MKIVCISLVVLVTAIETVKAEQLPIYIDIRVVNKLTSSNFDKTWSIYVGVEQTLYDALNNTQAKFDDFSFASERYTGLGQYVISMCHMVACNSMRQYWEPFGTDGKPIAKGVSYTYPKADDKFMFNLTTY